MQNKRLKTGVAYYGNRMLSHAITDMKDIARNDMDIVVHMLTHNDIERSFSVMKDIFKVKCHQMTFSLSGVQNKVQQFHAANPVPAETAAYALRCVAKAVYLATEQALKEYPGLPVVFSGGVASNSMLREVIAPLNPIFSEPQFSTDNAMGVAVLAHRSQEA